MFFLYHIVSPFYLVPVSNSFSFPISGLFLVSNSFPFPISQSFSHIILYCFQKIGLAFPYSVVLFPAVLYELQSACSEWHWLPEKLEVLSWIINHVQLTWPYFYSCFHWYITRLLEAFWPTWRGSKLFSADYCVCYQCRLIKHSRANWERGSGVFGTQKALKNLNLNLDLN